MCNKELFTRKRKIRIEDKEKEADPGPSKVSRKEGQEDEEQSMVKDNLDATTSTSGATSSYESDWSREEDLLIELTSMESNKEYKFSMLNYMPLMEITTNRVAQEWGIKPPTKI